MNDHRSATPIRAGDAPPARVARPSYRAPAWLPGGHAQTIWPYLLPRPALRYRRQRVETPDGDFWDFDWFDAPHVAPSSAPPPLVVLFHGLEGSSRAHYATALMRTLAARGWRGVVPHFRGCGGELNRRPRAYHSGDHEEAAAMLAAVRARVDEATPVYAVGVSLGGSVLLNWLGRNARTAARTLAGAAAVSAPIDLGSAGVAIDQGLNRIYTRNFLRTLKPKGIALARRYPHRLDAARIRRAHTLRDFDDALTAPLHGFDDAEDYWRRASSKPWLSRVGIPTLVVNARNDPFVPAASLPGAHEVSASVLLDYPDGGGHGGFLSGRFPGRLDWLPRRLLDFFVHGH